MVREFVKDKRKHYKTHAVEKHMQLQVTILHHDIHKFDIVNLKFLKLLFFIANSILYVQGDLKSNINTARDESTREIQKNHI